MAHYTDPNAPMSVTQADSSNPLAWSVLAAGVVALLFAGVFYFKTTSTEAKKKEVQTTIDSQDQQLRDLQPTVDRLTQYDGTAKNLTTLFQEQKKWEVVLGKIETSLYKRMKVTAFQVNDKGVFTMTGVTPSYLDYAKVYAALTTPTAESYFSTMQVMSVTKSDKPGATDITFTFQGTLTAAALTTVAANQ